MQGEVIVRQGFEDTEEDHLPSKQKEKQKDNGLYYSIPQAKPILSKLIIDHRKPKILIRNIRVDVTYPQILRSPLVVPNVSYEKQGKRQNLTGESTIWKRYIISGMYKCHYMKYNPLKGQEGERRGKRMKADFTKNSFTNEWLVATHVIDMSFLSQTTSIMARNLQQNNLVDQQTRLSQLKDEIVFDSALEGGNLMFVFSKTEIQNPREFSLLLQNDINTKGYANWFYFKLFSVKPGPLRFHLVNLQKSFSFYSNGMKPVVYSVREGKGWRMEGHSISYYRNDLLKAENSAQRYSILSFTIDQKYANDLLFIAATVPYTYSHLLKFLIGFQGQVKSKTRIYYRRQSLAKTISGNDCPLITITAKRDRNQDNGRKKIAIVIARQHPSEVVSSWVTQGVLQSLINASQQSQQLLKKYIFKIVPMVNIDGVIYGNSRCDISGSDCNRKWTRNSNTNLYPVISAIRKLATQLIYQGYQIEYFLDLHGHSRKLGSFMYCCRAIDEIQSRIIAWLMSKITQKFAYEECRFGVSSFRKQTARGYFGMLLSSRKAITLQTSFFGYRTGLNFKPFTPSELRKLGASLMLTVHADTFRTNGVVNWATVRNQIRQQMMKKKFHQESQSQGSDSDPQGDQFNTAEKANTFLSPAVASKIGLVEYKVVQKPKKQVHKDFHGISPEGRRNQELRREQFKRQSMASMNPPQMNAQLLVSQSLPKNQSLGDLRRGLRQTKSVTKIEPFKFKSQQKRSPSKRIRIALDIQRLQSKQTRLSAPSLPIVRARNHNQFWNQLKNEYQNLLIEKRVLVQQAKESVQLRYKQ